MYCLEVIKSINEKPIAIRDNFNRDSGFCQSKAGFVIHSGIHRSTGFIDKEELPDAWQSFNYWRQLGQAAINGWIEASIEDCPLDDCEATACARALQAQGWDVTVHGTLTNASPGIGHATRASGGLGVQVAGCSWRELYERATAPASVHLSECQRIQREHARRLSKHREALSGPLSASGHTLSVTYNQM